jgi:hypothetical protein
VRRDEPDAVLLVQALMKRIAVASAVANHSFWFGSRGALLDAVQEPAVLPYAWTKNGEQVTGIITSSSA